MIDGLPSPEFERGRSYRRRELHHRFGGQQQGGISTPQGRPYLLLFTGTGERHGYQDGWDPTGVFRYSCEGQRGDMKFTGGNRAIRDAAKDGKDLHLFEQRGMGQVRYVGCFSCSSWDYTTTKDRDGAPRQAIVFHLTPIEAVSEPAGPVPPGGPSLADLRRRAFDGAREAGEGSVKDAKRRAYDRSRHVRDYVLARANGTCEACLKPAPFVRADGTPYLEPHHTRRLSDGGPDHPRWVGGICPTCHREIHYGANGSALNRALEDHVGALEARAVVC
jgi:5-methylcytosine-specific restriction protein A